MLICFTFVQLLATLWTVAYQVPLSMGFSRQEYWNELPSPPPGDLPDLGMEPESLMSPALTGGSLPLVPPGKPNQSTRQLISPHFTDQETEAQKSQVTCSGLVSKCPANTRTQCLPLESIHVCSVYKCQLQAHPNSPAPGTAVFYDHSNVLKTDMFQENVGFSFDLSISAKEKWSHEMF